jgi:hypothetical protein
MIDEKTIIADKLSAIKDSVTPADRAAAEAEIPISRPTLDKYLSGDIVKVDTGEKLLRFLAARIKERIENIRATNLV